MSQSRPQNFISTEGLDVQDPKQDIWVTPQWFYEARSVPFIESAVTVDGCDVHYLEWGNSQNQTILLVHGNGAHAHWFHTTGALLAQDYHIVSMTFSGMGDSQHRASYDREVMINDIVGVIDGLSLAQPILVAHSFGGMVAIPTAHKLGDKLKGFIVVDHVVQPADNTVEWFKDFPPSRPHIVRPDFDSILARFKLLPDQPCPNKWLKRYIAERSVKPVQDGWIWKFDPSIYDGMRLGVDHEGIIRNYALPIGFVYGAQTEEFMPNDLDFMLSILPSHAVIGEVPNSGHHVMLDQPKAFAQIVDRTVKQLVN